MISITDNCTAEDYRRICSGLIDYNFTESSGKINLPCDKDIRLALKNQHGEVLGGIAGHIALYCWFIEELWLEPRCRGNGYGKALLMRGETIAREKGCTIAQTSTFSFQSPAFYSSRGYSELAVIDLCDGIKHHFFSKRL